MGSTKTPNRTRAAAKKPVELAMMSSRDRWLSLAAIAVSSCASTVVPIGADGDATHRSDASAAADVTAARDAEAAADGAPRDGGAPDFVFGCGPGAAVRVEISTNTVPSAVVDLDVRARWDSGGEVRRSYRIGPGGVTSPITLVTYHRCDGPADDRLSLVFDTHVTVPGVPEPQAFTQAVRYSLHPGGADGAVQVTLFSECTMPSTGCASLPDECTRALLCHEGGAVCRDGRCD